MKKHAKHFPWNDNVIAAKAAATALYSDLIANPGKHQNVERWQDPAFKRTTVEWTGEMR